MNNNWYVYTYRYSRAPLLFRRPGGTFPQLRGAIIKNWVTN